MPFIQDLYAIHVKQKNGNYFEGDGRKHSLKCYQDSFQETIDSIKNEGFNPG